MRIDKMRLIHSMAPLNLTIFTSLILLVFAILFSRHLVCCSVNNNDPNTFILRRPNHATNRHILLLPLTLSPPPPSNFSAARRRRHRLLQSHLPNAHMRLHDDLLKNGYCYHHSSILTYLTTENSFSVRTRHVMYFSCLLFCTFYENSFSTRTRVLYFLRILFRNCLRVRNN